MTCPSYTANQWQRESWNTSSKVLHTDENLVSTLILMMKCWETNQFSCFLWKRKKNRFNLAEKHMLEFRERKIFSVPMTPDSMHFSSSPPRWSACEGKAVGISLEEDHTIGLCQLVSLSGLKWEEVTRTQEYSIQPTPTTL